MPWPPPQRMKNSTESMTMTCIRRAMRAARLTSVPRLVPARGQLPDEVTGKVEGIQMEVALDVYRPAADCEAKESPRRWMNVRFNKSAAGKVCSTFVRITAGETLRPEQGDPARVRLVQPLHSIACALGPMPDGDVQRT